MPNFTLVSSVTVSASTVVEADSLQLERVTGMRLSGVCGRVRSLLDKKALEVVGEAKDPQTGKKQEVLALPKRQLELI